MDYVILRWLVAALLSGFVGLPAALADGRTTNDAVYNEEQAEAGEQLYEEHCLLCHDKKYFRPVFKTWEGQTLDTMLVVMSTTMPQSNPGVLPLDDYVDILAYMLSLNRYPAGAEPLSDDDGALRDITIAARQ